MSTGRCGVGGRAPTLPSPCPPDPICQQNLPFPKHVSTQPFLSTSTTIVWFTHSTHIHQRATVFQALFSGWESKTDSSCSVFSLDDPSYWLAPLSSFALSFHSPHRSLQVFLKYQHFRVWTPPVTSHCFLIKTPRPPQPCRWAACLLVSSASSLDSLPTGTPTSFPILKYVMAFSLFRAFICLYFLLKQWLPNFLLTIIPSKKYFISLTSKHINLHIKGTWVPHDNTSSMFCSFLKKSSRTPLTCSLKRLLPLLVESWIVLILQLSTWMLAAHRGLLQPSDTTQAPDIDYFSSESSMYQSYIFLSWHLLIVCLAGHITSSWRRGPVCAVPRCIVHIWVNDEHNTIYVHIPWMADWVGE